MKSFQDLTTRGQARRLRQLALDALKSYDLDFAGLRLISNETNCIFEIKTHSGERWILRVTLPEGGHTRDHITAEMDWLSALAGETTLQVPRPLPARNGRLVVEAGAAGVPEARFCGIFSWVPGTDLANHLTRGNLMRLGQLSAQLHEHARTYQPPENLGLFKFDRPFPFPEPVILFEPRFNDSITGAQRLLFQHWLERVQNALDWLAASGEPMRIIHGDLHQWNVRISRQGLSPIDFEDLMWGWPAQDIATTLYYLLDETDYDAKRAAFEEGYRSVSPWPEHYPGEINTFIASRGLGLFNFVLNNGDLLHITPQDFANRIEKRLANLAEG
jgi:Ser/Thr protein kinase RdoA (MazF antagonist)